MSFCRTLSRAAVLSALAALLTLPASATTFVRVSDENLVEGASAIAVGRVLAVDDAVGAAGGISPSTDYRFALESRLKGSLPGSTLTVRVLGGRAPGGLNLRISGAPSFRVGERAILFLEPERAGVRRLEHFVQGAFHQAGPAAKSLALRDLAGAVEMKLTPDGPQAVEGGAPEAPRDFAAFVDWIRKRAAGRAAPADYRLDPEEAEVRSIVEEYTLFSGGDGNHVRWFTFDSGGTVSWLTHETGQSGLADGGVSEATNGMTPWNSDPATAISYVNSGTTAASAGFTFFDGANTILWNDPNGEVGAFSCGSGGTLAIGGPWFGNGTTNFMGTPYHPISGADVIVNNGLDCYFGSANGVTNATAMLAHELGHTLGLDHSADSSALMYFSIQNGRGPGLGGDDVAAIACVYAGSCGGSPTAPSAPSGLAASALSSSQIQLTWLDNANNETSYRIEMKPAGGSYSQILSLAANGTSTVVSGLAPATAFTFRVRAAGSGGLFSGYSNEATAITQAAGVPPNTPTALQATATSASQVLLNWLDGSNNETGFRVEVRTAQGSYADVGGVAANVTSAQVSGLSASTTYFFRVRAAGSGGLFSGYSNEANAKTFDAGGTCAPSSTGLCLNGGRFRVSVAWQQSGGSTGVGTIVPALTTADSGVFWFFAPANWEMMVKVLDGCAVNGRHWVFFGAATNQGFTLTVSDTATGQTKTYTNPIGSVSPIHTDTDAFATCP